MTCPYVDSQMSQPMQWRGRMWTVRCYSQCNDVRVCGQSDVTANAMTCPYVDSQMSQPMQWRARMWTVICHSQCNDVPVCGQSDVTANAMTCPYVDSQMSQPMQWRARMWTVRCSINSPPYPLVVSFFGNSVCYITEYLREQLHKFDKNCRCFFHIYVNIRI